MTNFITQSRDYGADWDGMWEDFLQLLTTTTDAIEAMGGISQASHSPSTGSKLFPLVQSTRLFPVGTAIQAVAVANGAVSLSGTVSASSAGSVTINVTSFTGGGGPYTLWLIQMAGPVGPTGGVSSVAGRTGAVTLAVADVSGAAPLASPVLTGTPIAPTAAPGTNTTQLATTAFVQAAAAPQIGDILLTARAAPAGYIACGSVYSQASYAALFALVGLIVDPAATFTSRASGAGSTQLNDAAYGGGYFVIVGNSGYLATSPDGITWTSRTSSFSTTDIYSVAYNGTHWVAVGASGKIATATDPTGTWTQRTSGFGANQVYAVAYGGTYWVIVGAGGSMATATDPTGTWTARTSGFGATDIYGIGYGNGLWVAVGASSTMTTASDPTSTWTTRTSSFAGGIIRVTYANGKWAAVGAGLATSTNGTSWSQVTVSGAIIDTSTARRISWSAGVWLMCNGSGTIATSPDLAAWTQRVSNISSNATNIALIAGSTGALAIVGGAGGALASAALASYNTATQFATPAVTVPLGAYAYIKAS